MDFALGPFWGSLGDFYFQNQVVINSLVVGMGLIGMVNRRKNKQKEATEK
ncbi:hypothetical protein [Virgibacillus sp. DJP39]